MARAFYDGFFGDLFEDAFRGFPPCRPEKPGEGMMRGGFGFMKTDIIDAGESFELQIELPGYKKSDVSAELKEGYLIIRAGKKPEFCGRPEPGERPEKPEKPDKRYIRKERFDGGMKRSFYVGKKLKEEDIRASFADGILYVVVPKENTIEREEEKKMISIL